MASLWLVVDEHGWKSNVDAGDAESAAAMLLFACMALLETEKQELALRGILPGRGIAAFMARHATSGDEPLAPSEHTE